MVDLSLCPETQDNMKNIISTVLLAQQKQMVHTGLTKPNPVCKINRQSFRKRMLIIRYADVIKTGIECTFSVN